MRTKSAVGVYVAGVCLGVFLVGSGSGLAQTTEKKIEKVPMVQSDPSSGPQMYKDYCAVCHGADGKGGGPAASALRAASSAHGTLESRARLIGNAGVGGRSLRRWRCSRGVARPFRSIILFLRAPC